MEVVLRTSVAYTERSKCEHTDHLPDPRSAARRQRWGRERGGAWSPGGSGSQPRGRGGPRQHDSQGVLQ